MELVMKDGRNVGFNKASILQGIIMEIVDGHFAEKMHQQGLKPYSQYVRREDDKNIWHINAFSDDANEYLIEKMLEEEFTDITFKHDDISGKIVNKECHSIDKSELINDFYSKDSSNIIKIEFITPTSFKTNGRYFFFPDVRLIFQSLMKKYDSCDDSVAMYSEDTLEQLINCTEIIGYNIRSTSYELEGVKIPAFMGNIKIKIKGAQTMVNYANLLLRFGEYSGVGIKCAIGMGGIKIINDKKVNK